MNHKPLRPTETVRIIQAAIEGLTLDQLFIRDTLAALNVHGYDEATAYARKLTAEEQKVLVDLLQAKPEPEAEADLHYVDEAAP